MVGSTLGDASSRLRARGVPRSGIRTQDGLKVAEGALPDTTMGPVDARDAGHKILRIVAIVSGSLAAVLLLFALGLAILSHTSAFRITSVETNDTEHVSATDVAALIRVEEGATLLNVDAEAVERAVRHNPWIGGVEVQSAFPNKLIVRTYERKVGALVAMRSGGLCWLLGDDGVWIEPLRVEAQEGESLEDASLAEADRQGVVMISGTPSDVSPVAGTETTDEAIKAALSLDALLPPEFKGQVASYSAPDADGLSCILKSGVEVSFGTTANVEAKVAVARKVLDEFSGQVTYVNVRVPARPTYRRVESSYVREGTGATGVAIDEESNFDKLPQRKPEEDDLETSEIPEEYIEGGSIDGSTGTGYSGNGYSTDEY